MNSAKKCAILKEIYRIHEQYIPSLSLACKIHCADCCTRNVTMTTMEGVDIVQNLAVNKRDDLFRRLTTELSKKRFHPEITVNGMAERCAKGEALPEEQLDPNWGKCPLLIDDQCSIYEFRPFECRSFVSTRICREGGYADMSAMTINVNNLFRQYIEHIDADAASGNLTDVLLSLQGGESTTLISNRPITVLMIDPEFKNQLEPIMESLNTIQVPVP